jgi:cytochrome c oxidase subunit 2
MGDLFQLPENISTYGARIDDFYILITWIVAIVFVAVWITLGWFLVKYRHREGARALYLHGNHKLEWIWTLATAAVVFAVGLSSFPLWQEIKNPNRFPAPGLELIVAAKQFEWNFSYPGADGQIGTADDFVRRNQLHIPMGVPVRVTLTAEDVIHSFYVPEMRLKQDAVPGMQIPVWFQATKTGSYVMGCAELCGLQHYRMRATVTIHTPEEYARWHAEQVAAAAPPAAPAAGQQPPAPTNPGGAAPGGPAHVH